MRRLVLAAAATVFVGGLAVAGSAGAANDNAPHSGPGAHPHHIHNGNGCRDMNAPPMEPGSRGLHNAANRENNSNDNNSHDNMHHGTCSAHGFTSE